MPYEYTRQNPLWDDVCYLISKNTYVDEDGIVQEGEPTKREVFCNVSGVYMQEFFRGYQMGIKPRYTVKVFQGDYHDERLIEYNGQTYVVYRMYPSNDMIELYIREDIGEWQT